MKNFIIGYGETLTSKVEVKNGSGDKKHPYSYAEAKQRFIEKLNNIIDEIETKPADECSNNEVVIKFIQHPSYLAKTYYPKTFFKKYGMRDLGSRSMRIRPEKWAVKRHPEEGLTSCIYVSAPKENYRNMLDLLENDSADETTLKALQTFEDISTFTAAEKIKHVSNDEENLNLEIALHASKDDEAIIRSFIKYIELNGGIVKQEKIKTVGGLTFLPATIQKGKEEKIAAFSHLRVLRSMPKLRFNEPDTIRSILKHSFNLPNSSAINENIRVCLFDGGLGDNHLLGKWAREIVPDDINSSHPELLSHGGEVCGTYLFGPHVTGNSELPTPYTKVDVVRVLSPTDVDPDLFDVLDRIESVLKRREYKYVNLSLGPRLAIDDDDVHVWTSVLDSLLQDGSCLATVAIGNDGHLEGEHARIQPPSDMVNCFAIGASDSQSKEWTRAPYSCIGPGRSPGLVKPDGVMFGGSRDELFEVYSPLTHQIVGTAGTSYAAPFALRVAAGIDAITNFNLKPATVKALMIHHADNNGWELREVGWGRMPSTPEEIIECLDDEAIIVYQGDLHPSQHLRIPIPLPNDIDCTWVHLKATFCFHTITDPEHPLHYTRGGLDITFRPNEEKKKTTEQGHSDTKTFFSDKNLYPTEEELRADAYKWETCVTREARFKATTLKSPSFDVKYHNREQAGTTPQNSDREPIPYSLILSIRAEGDGSIYNKVLQQNRTLQAVNVVNRVEVLT